MDDSMNRLYQELLVAVKREVVRAEQKILLEKKEDEEAKAAMEEEEAALHMLSQEVEKTTNCKFRVFEVAQMPFAKDKTQDTLVNYLLGRGIESEKEIAEATADIDNWRKFVGY